MAVTPVPVPKVSAPEDPNALAPGWVVGPGGGNMVQNTATGQVVDRNHPIYTAAAGGAGATAPAQAPAGTAGSTLSAPAVAGATVAPGTPTTAAGAFQQALVNRLTAPPPDASSPAIAPAIAANKLAGQRGMERARAQLAERAAANGTSSSGGFDTALQGLNQDRATQEGQFAGQAIQGQAAQQAQELTSALALYGGMMTEQDRLAMQEKLANLSAQVQRESIANQASLGGQDIALRGELGRGNLNLGLLSALMGNQVANSSLGLQAGLGAANLNQQAVLQSLGYL